ncbi:MAG: hypothetical protein BGP12_20115 [Rhodospirillales bacterium 70-18]|nr:MAG: hypothetical protein BGP12_20115 [Rhodospirillales bacterium 70-18]
MPICTCRPKGRDRRALLAAFGGVAGLLLLSTLYLAWLGPAPHGSAAVGGAFRLAATQGGAVDERSFPGRYRLVYFGYTHCPDVCPTTLATLAEALRRLGPLAARVQPLFITLDPARDSLAVLRAYLAGFSPRLIGLTGTAAELAAVERAFRVTSVAHPDGPDHSSVLYLMAPDGRFVAPVAADASAAGMARAISAGMM